MRGLTEMMLTDNRIPVTPTPDGVEIVTRGSGEKKIRMTINHNDHPVSIDADTLAPFACRIERI